MEFEIATEIVEFLRKGFAPKCVAELVLGNHDRSRVASRIGREQARVAAMLLLTLRGTPTGQSSEISELRGAAQVIRAKYDQEDAMGLADILTGMRNGPRGEVGSSGSFRRYVTHYDGPARLARI